MGPTNIMMEVTSICDWMGVTSNTAYLILESLNVPLFRVGNRAFFNLYSLDKVLYYLNRMGGPGYIAPGSTLKDSGRYKKGKFKVIPTRITEEDVLNMKDPEFEAEWMATGPQGRTKAKYKRKPTNAVASPSVS